MNVIVSTTGVFLPGSPTFGFQPAIANRQPASAAASKSTFSVLPQYNLSVLAI
jgi:hypothetical protein